MAFHTFTTLCSHHHYLEKFPSWKEICAHQRSCPIPPVSQQPLNHLPYRFASSGRFLVLHGARTLNTPASLEAGVSAWRADETRGPEMGTGQAQS